MCYSFIKTYPCGHSRLAYSLCNGEVLDRPPVHKLQVPCGIIKVSLELECVEDEPCPNTACAFRDKGRGWTCCHCGSRDNLIGFCSGRREGESAAGCRHTCCERCEPGEVGYELPIETGDEPIDDNPEIFTRPSRELLLRTYTGLLCAAIIERCCVRYFAELDPFRFGPIQGIFHLILLAAVVPPLAAIVFPFWLRYATVWVWPVIYVWRVTGFVSREWERAFWRKYETLHRRFL
ncbi:hypothetical protein F4778DRAFT_545471 [Xylariomycetidae sp. FL2044]|nr:hypothetical protein F4778DRAFT_545471 [Xylariomycetidae sp. FL2044]